MNKYQKQKSKAKSPSDSTIADTARKGVRNAYEAFKARAHYLENLQDLQKWSVAAGLTGLLAGLSAIVFNFCLNGVSLGFQRLMAILPHPALIIFLPVIGGLIAGLIRYSLNRDAFSFGSGVDRMIDSVHNEDGRIKPLAIASTILGAAFTIGSGGSAGREGPAAFIGAGCGSLVSNLIRRFHLDRIFRFTFSDKDVRFLTICGSAAGLGAIFRAPLGGALFSSSVLYTYGMETRAILPAAISSITGYLVFALAYGFESPFHAPSMWSFNFLDLLIVIIIGVLASGVGLAYQKVFFRVFAWFRSLEIPDYVKPALGGLVVGVIIFLVPRVMGMGYETIEDIIDYKVGLSVLLAIIVCKILATSFTIGSGGTGGDLVPSMVVGAALGGAIGIVAKFLLPNTLLHPTLYVIAGMGAVYSSIAKIPLATAILLCETTRNFSMVVPLLAANAVGFLAASDRTIYETQKADADIKHGDLLAKVHIGSIMRRKVLTVSPNNSIADVAAIVQQTGRHGFPVLDGERLTGVISWNDIRGIAMDVRAETLVRDIMIKNVVTLTPQGTVKDALELLDEKSIGRIVIVDEDDAGKVIGVITRKDLVGAYMRALERER